MAGGYLTDTGFVEDKTQQTVPEQVPETSVCGKALTEPTVNSLEEESVDVTIQE